MKNKTIWNIYCGAIIVLTILTFTPLITPSNTYQPMVMGMPYTLGAGIIHTLIMVGIVLFATRVHPGRRE